MNSLEIRKITVNEKGKSVELPALNQKWVEKRKFLHFPPPSSITSGQIDLKEWKEILEFFKADLHWLLTLPHYKFWSQIVHDASLHASLVSFLQEAPRFFSEEIEMLKKNNTWDLFKETKKLVFLTFLRMSTHKESKDCYITPAAFGNIIYDNFIFDIPKIMDLCVLYGPSNSTLLTKMLQNIFTHQPKFHNFDLEETANSLIQVFHLILAQLGLEEMQAAGNDHSGPLSAEELNEIIIYTLDIAATMWFFIDIYPAAASVFTTAGIPNQLVEFYEKSVPYLSRNIEVLSSNKKENLVHNLNMARKFLIQLYNTLLHAVSIKPLLANSMESSELDKENCVEQWIEWLTCLVSERQRHFVVDYNAVFPFQDDIDLVTQIGIPIDTTRVDYIKGGAKGFLVEFGISLTPAPLRAVDGGVDPEKLIALIKQVKELLPDLRDNFVQDCLKHYDYNAEAVINAILEDNLAPHLAERQFPDSQPIVPLPVEFEEPAEISKKSRTKTVRFDELQKVLNDTHDLKSVILDRVDEQIAAEYEDEYDDTYDSVAVGCEEPDAHTGEDEQRRSFVVPRVLRPKDDDYYEDSEEDSEEVTDKPRDQFVPNPAELREKAEQRRNARRGYRPPGPAPSQRNVVGGPRGQGQDKDTIIARRNKTENKTRGANHNRRYMADRKRREF